MNAKVTIEYLVKNICNPDDFGPDEEFRTFDELTRNLIKEEGIHGVAEDDYQIISVEETL